MKEILPDAANRAGLAAGESEGPNSIYGLRAGAAFLAAWPTRPCKLVFLDFDGVLNNSGSIAERGNCYEFDPKSVEALNEILRRTGALIVISSSWRCYWPLQELVEGLDRAGVLPGRVVGKTPELRTPRGEEVDAWLKAAPFPVAAFVILDDMDDMVMHQGRLVLTRFDDGLTLDHVGPAVAALEQ